MAQRGEGAASFGNIPVVGNGPTSPAGENALAPP